MKITTSVHTKIFRTLSVIRTRRFAVWLNVAFSFAEKHITSLFSLNIGYVKTANSRVDFDAVLMRTLLFKVDAVLLQQFCLKCLVSQSFLKKIYN